MPTIGGVRFYMTHGHLHKVKMTHSLLLKDARSANAQVVLYGHTHIPECSREADGLWVMNPGAGGYCGTAGVIEIEDGNVRSCRIVGRTELEEME